MIVLHPVNIQVTDQVSDYIMQILSLPFEQRSNSLFHSTILYADGFIKNHKILINGLLQSLHKCLRLFTERPKVNYKALGNPWLIGSMRLSPFSKQLVWRAKRFASETSVIFLRLENLLFFTKIFHDFGGRFFQFLNGCFQQQGYSKMDGL